MKKGQLAELRARCSQYQPVLAALSAACYVRTGFQDMLRTAGVIVRSNECSDKLDGPGCAVAPLDADTAAKIEYGGSACRTFAEGARLDAHLARAVGVAVGAAVVGTSDQPAMFTFSAAGVSLLSMPLSCTAPLAVLPTRAYDLVSSSEKSLACALAAIGWSRLGAHGSAVASLTQRALLHCVDEFHATVDAGDAVNAATLGTPAPETATSMTDLADRWPTYHALIEMLPGINQVPGFLRAEDDVWHVINSVRHDFADWRESLFPSSFTSRRQQLAQQPCIMTQVRTALRRITAQITRSTGSRKDMVVSEQSVANVCTSLSGILGADEHARLRQGKALTLTVAKFLALTEGCVSEVMLSLLHGTLGTPSLPSPTPLAAVQAILAGPGTAVEQLASLLSRANALSRKALALVASSAAAAATHTHVPGLDALVNTTRRFGGLSFPVAEMAVGVFATLARRNVMSGAQARSLFAAVQDSCSPWPFLHKLLSSVGIPAPAPTTYHAPVAPAGSTLSACSAHSAHSASVPNGVSGSSAAPGLPLAEGHSSAPTPVHSTHMAGLPPVHSIMPVDLPSMVRHGMPMYHPMYMPGYMGMPPGAMALPRPHHVPMYVPASDSVHSASPRTVAAASTASFAVPGAKRPRDRSASGSSAGPVVY